VSHTPGCASSIASANVISLLPGSKSYTIFSGATPALNPSIAARICGTIWSPTANRRDTTSHSGMRCPIADRAGLRSVSVSDV